MFSEDLSSSVTGIILAGGKSTRMGKDKALLEIEGDPFIKRIADVLAGVFKDVMIISNHGTRYAFLDLPVCSDIFENCGPLGGIQAGLTYAKTPAILVVSCDLPLINARLIEHLLDVDENIDASVYSTEESVQPLFGLYRKRCLSAIELRIRAREYSVRDCLGVLKTRVVTPPADHSILDVHSLMNINTPADYHSCLRTFVS